MSYFKVKANTQRDRLGKRLWEKGEKAAFIQ